MKYLTIVPIVLAILLLGQQSECKRILAGILIIVAVIIWLFA